jgi:hypothetical protein
MAPAHYLFDARDPVWRRLLETATGSVTRWSRTYGEPGDQKTGSSRISLHFVDLCIIFDDPTC